VPDLLLLRDLARDTGAPTLTEVKRASIAVFESRAAEANGLGLPGRHWPPGVAAHHHWQDDYRRAAASAGITLTLEKAAAEVNAWIAEIDAAR
jgi:hypothetical protein